jgi:hypothetical protein
MLSVFRLKPEKNLAMSSAVALKGSPFIFTTLPSRGSAAGDEGGIGAASPEPVELLLSSLARCGDWPRGLAGLASPGGAEAARIDASVQLS